MYVFPTKLLLGIPTLCNVGSLPFTPLWVQQLRSLAGSRRISGCHIGYAWCPELRILNSTTTTTPFPAYSPANVRDSNFLDWRISAPACRSRHAHSRSDPTTASVSLAAAQVDLSAPRSFACRENQIPLLRFHHALPQAQALQSSTT